MFKVGEYMMSIVGFDESDDQMLTIIVWIFDFHSSTI